MIALLLALSVTLPTELVELRDKYAPAAVDPAPVRTLFDRLVNDGAYEGENISVELIEVEVPEPEGPVRDLLYRRAFTHLEASEWTVHGEKVDAREYDVSLDGQLLAVRHVVVDKGMPTVRRLSPSDKDVQARWKKLSRKLLKLGKLYQA